MKRAIFLLTLAAAGQAACGSTGSTSGSAYSNAEPGRAAPVNPQQSDLNSSGPSGNSNQPLPNLNTPPTNPNAPPGPDQTQGTGSGSSTIFVPSEGFCTTICAGVADSPCSGECLGRCAAYAVFSSRCPTQFGAAAGCVQQGGFTCDDQNNLHLANTQCDELVTALITCGTSTNPLPTATGLPNEPLPMPVFDGGR